MNNEIQLQINKLQKEVIGEILTLGEIGLTEKQFRQFKKKVLQIYHDRLSPETNKLLLVFHARTIQRHFCQIQVGRQPSGSAN
jgi:hypothetical protein